MSIDERVSVRPGSLHDRNLVKQKFSEIGVFRFRKCRKPNILNGFHVPLEVRDKKSGIFRKCPVLNSFPVPQGSRDKAVCSGTFKAKPLPPRLSERVSCKAGNQFV
jgi:hypothetical protein